MSHLQVTQLVFALVAPGNMTSNLMAAAISGAGASQAGDMMQARRKLLYLPDLVFDFFRILGFQDRPSAQAVSQAAIYRAVHGNFRWRRCCNSRVLAILIRI